MISFLSSNAVKPFIKRLSNEDMFIVAGGLVAAVGIALRMTKKQVKP